MHGAAGRRRVLGRRRPARRASATPTPRCSTSATRCTWSPAGPTDRLALQEQDAVAALLGLLDADALLRQVVDGGRTIAYAIDVTWRRVGRAPARAARPGCSAPGRARSAGRGPLADGVVEQDGEVGARPRVDPRTDPALVLRAAAAAAQAGLPLAPPRSPAGRRSRPPLPVPWPAAAPRRARVSLLGAGRAAVPVWEELDQAGLIVRAAARLGAGAQPPAAQPGAPLHRRPAPDRGRRAAPPRSPAGVARPDLLLVAALLHDIGKGWPGDHTDAGVVVAADIGAALGFAAADVESLGRAGPPPPAAAGHGHPA